MRPVRMGLLIAGLLATSLSARTAFTQFTNPAPALVTPADCVRDCAGFSFLKGGFRRQKDLWGDRRLSVAGRRLNGPGGSPESGPLFVAGLALAVAVFGAGWMNTAEASGRGPLAVGADTNASGLKIGKTMRYPGSAPAGRSATRSHGFGRGDFRGISVRNSLNLMETVEGYARRRRIP